MTGAEFARLLTLAGLQQVEFGRLMGALTGTPGPDGHQVSRWCRGVRPVPRWAVAVLRLFLQLPGWKQADYLTDIRKGR